MMNITKLSPSVVFMCALIEFIYNFRILYCLLPNNAYLFYFYQSVGAEFTRGYARGVAS
jgi:hypothetical protein